MQMLIPLRVYSEYSLLESCIRANHATEFAKKHNINMIGITDKNNMFGAMQWCETMLKEKIKPIVGVELSIGESQITALCKNHTGYVELSNLMSSSNLHNEGVIQADDLDSLKNCFILCGAEGVNLIDKLITTELEFGIAISRQIADSQIENELFSASFKHDIPIIAAPKFYYIKKEEQISVDALLCIKNGTYLIEQNRIKAEEDCSFESIFELTEKFYDIPQALENCYILAQKCNFALKPQPPIMPKIDIENPAQKLREMVFAGLQQKIDAVENNIDNPDKYIARAEEELQMITEMNFCDYFLIVADIIQWAKNNAVPIGPGRGSGASCLIAWALGITNVNPIKFNLLFERFLNPSRVTLPDFDIDFCQEKRDSVVRYIQQRFGEENVAHIITFGSLQYRAAIRDIGRIMQMPYSVVDSLCKQLPAPIQGVAPSIKQLREEGALKDILNAENERLFAIAESIEGIPRHTSIHPAGIVIGNQKLSNIVPLIKEQGVAVIQFSMKQAEQIGLIKFDILGLTILSVLQKAVELIHEHETENQKNTFNLNAIPLNDDETFEMLQKGMVTAVFQIDSPGFRNLMIEMQPNCIEDIIAAGALYRPGPMQDIPQFISNKKEGAAVYPFKEMEQILGETYSVVVYQEQVLQIAKTIAGYSLREADLLRRAMAKKIKSEMKLHEEKFINGVINKYGESEEIHEKAKKLYDNLARFASYGFPKAHSTPYAVMTYQSAFLKRHYTIEFFCATLFYEHTLKKIENVLLEAKKMEIEIIPPNINISNQNFSIQNTAELYLQSEAKADRALVYGLAKIKGVGSAADAIVAERTKNGPFKSIENFTARVSVNKTALESLVLAGAFDVLSSKPRNQLFKDITNQVNSISLFEFDEIRQDDPIDKIRNEVTVMGTTFTQDLSINLPKLGITNQLEDITSRGIIFGIGIGLNTHKSRDGKVLTSYQFIDCLGIREMFTSQEHDYVWQKVVIEVERSAIRYTIKQVHTVEAFLARYKKIFINYDDSGETSALKPGNTSIYLNDGNDKVLLGDFTITLEYLQKIHDNICGAF